MYIKVPNRIIEVEGKKTIRNAGQEEVREAVSELNITGIEIGMWLNFPTVDFPEPPTKPQDREDLRRVERHLTLLGFEIS